MNQCNTFFHSWRMCQGVVQGGRAGGRCRGKVQGALGGRCTGGIYRGECAGEYAEGMCREKVRGRSAGSKAGKMHRGKVQGEHSWDEPEPCAPSESYLVLELCRGGNWKQRPLQCHFSEHASQGPHINPWPTCTAKQRLHQYTHHHQISLWCGGGLLGGEHLSVSQAPAMVRH